jgi:hypothetical protein
MDQLPRGDTNVHGLFLQNIPPVPSAKERERERERERARKKRKSAKRIRCVPVKRKE